ncbi:MAG: LysE family translocator [Flavobacteriaceae bacterium]|nr:LysE family translocator [Flavobacteriaceae bacterium]
MPGPDIIFVIMQSITNGKKYGIITALGLVSGIIIHTTLIAFGIAAMIQRSDTLFFMIKLFGAIYLFYLAFKTFKSSSEIHLEDIDSTKKPLLLLYKQGFIMNLLNPKVVIFFLAFFPGFIIESSGNITRQIYTLGILFMIQAFLVFSFVSIVSDKLTSFLRGNKRFELYLHWFQIVVFIAIGFYILFSNK